MLLQAKYIQKLIIMRRRWIWELIQNASDCANPDVSIYVQTYNDSLSFSHNGSPFTYEHLMNQAIGYLAKAKQLPCLKLATVQVIYYCRVRVSVDNYAPKFILDSLVRAGVLVDDRGEWVNVLPVRIEIDRERPRTEVTIRETKGK